MRQPKLGVCFYPTTVGLIDDNKAYLKHLAARLTMVEKLPCLMYDDPQEALHILTNQYKSDSFIHRCLINQEPDEFDHLIAELDVTAIHQEIYNPHRFSKVTVLVIDFPMPGVNRLEICRQLRETPVKVIMLTDEMSKDFAVEVFNEDIIDRFILKNTPNLLDVLAQTIHELQADYFLDLSKMVLNKSADFSKETLICLDDPIFVEFFKQLLKANHIIEYSLIDTHGSFQLLDAKGNPSWLAVANEELMLDYANLAKDDNAPAAIITSLKTKQRIPYFHTEDDFTTRPAEWEPYLHPAKVLQGKETYYYAYISDPNAYEVDRDAIVSYKQFLATHRKASTG